MDPQPAPTRHSGAELAREDGGRNPEAAQGKPSLCKPSLSSTNHFTFFTETAMKKTRNSYDPSEVPHRPYLPSLRPERRKCPLVFRPFVPSEGRCPLPSVRPQSTEVPSHPSSARPERKCPRIPHPFVLSAGKWFVHPARQVGCTNHSPGVEGLPPPSMAENERN